MICIWNYYITKQRLREAIKTVEMMGGPDECQPMVVAQADYIGMELEYYKEEIKSLLKWSSICGILVSVGYCVYILK